MARLKYTKELLEVTVKQCLSVSQVLKVLGLKQAGGSHAYVSAKLREFGVDISHFLGKAANCGETHKGGKKTEWQDVLILRSSGHRQKAHVLRRALIESGRKYECAECKIFEWCDKTLFLHVDHIDGNWLDDRLLNLRFLCPNCHSQTPNYCGSKGLSDLTSRSRSFKKMRMAKWRNWQPRKP